MKKKNFVTLIMSVAGGIGMKNRKKMIAPVVAGIAGVAGIAAAVICIVRKKKEVTIDE